MAMAEGRTVKSSGAFFGKGWGTTSRVDLADVVAAGERVSKSPRNISRNRDK
ncbi:hypothetical protein [Streptomyces sp. NPDC058155]|uniref:hypothetical protein n=1 Tax=Streptomyces sp. NPDC058155 TaxID=3346359 RepID=UPI0036E4A741